MVTESPRPGDAMTSAPSITTSLLIGSIVTLIIYIIYQRLTRERWEQYGVKEVVVTPTDLANVRTLHTRLSKLHGDTYGFNFNGLELATQNMDLLKHIMVKDFNNFVNRGVRLVSKCPVDSSVFFAKDEKWKRLRHLTSPSFSTSKLKLISKTVEESAQRLTDLCVKCAENNKLVPLKKNTSQYTSEIISRTAFGFKTNAIGEDNDEFTEYSRNLFRGGRQGVLRVIFATLRRFPGIMHFLVKTLQLDYFDPIAAAARGYFNVVLQSTIPERIRAEQSNGKKPTDMLQSLIAAKVNEDKIDPKNSLSEDEIIGHSILIVFAGFETTATTLQMAIYLLAKHPDIQEKVFQEIQSVVQSTTPTHEELAKLKYIEQVVDETLRLYPPVAIVNRKALETKTYGDVTIPKGATVNIPIVAILKNAKFWPNPEKFDPDRFTEETKAARDPMAFIPFGYGPRLCVGMRLAYLEMKIGLVHLLRKVKFELNEHTDPPLGKDVELRQIALVMPTSPITLACKLRE